MSRVGDQMIMDFDKDMEEELTYKEWQVANGEDYWDRFARAYVGEPVRHDKVEETHSITEESKDLVGTLEEATEVCPLLKQVGGTHYNKHTIQPWDIIDEYDLNYYEGNIIKYVLRSKGKRLEDLKKAQHYLEKEISAWE